MDASSQIPTLTDIAQQLENLRNSIGEARHSNVEFLTALLPQVRACADSVAKCLEAEVQKRANEERVKAERARLDEIAALRARLLELERDTASYHALPLPPAVPATAVEVAMPSAVAVVVAPRPTAMPPPQLLRPIGRAGPAPKAPKPAPVKRAEPDGAAAPEIKRPKVMEPTGRGARGRGRAAAVGRGRGAGGGRGRGARAVETAAPLPAVPPFTGGSGVAQSDAAKEEGEPMACEDTLVLTLSGEEGQAEGGSAYEGETQPPEW